VRRLAAAFANSANTALHPVGNRLKHCCHPEERFFATLFHFQSHCASVTPLLTSLASRSSEENFMAFCKACGQEIGTATFCPKCGANQSAAAVPVAAPVASPTEGLQENVAGLLCYLLWWVTGIIFLLIDKRPFVKFHAAQSIVVFGGLSIIRIAILFLHGMGGLIGFGFFGLIGLLVWLLSVVLWIVLMIKAYQHQMFRLPIAADIADGLIK
jgi:uncharacterized membrane protein